MAGRREFGVGGQQSHGAVHDEIEVSLERRQEAGENGNRRRARFDILPHNDVSPEDFGVRIQQPHVRKIQDQHIRLAKDSRSGEIQILGDLHVAPIDAKLLTLRVHAPLIRGTTGNC